MKLQSLKMFKTTKDMFYKQFDVVVFFCELTGPIMGLYEPCPFMTLTSFCSCVGQFESNLVANPRRQIFSWRCSYPVRSFSDRMSQKTLTPKIGSGSGWGTRFISVIRAFFWCILPSKFLDTRKAVWLYDVKWNFQKLQKFVSFRQKNVIFFKNIFFAKICVLSIPNDALKPDFKYGH